MKLALPVVLCTLLLIACGEAAEHSPLPAPQRAVVDSHAVRMSELVLKLMGDWTDEQTEPGAVVHERWRRTDDAFYSGIGFVMAGLDTVFIEHLNISADSAGKVVYRVRVPSQNAGEEIDFVLTECRGDSMVFENPAHDFPTRIAYTLEADGTWIARVSGPGKDGSPRMLKYSFKPVAPM